MRVVIQRVKTAKVVVDNKTVGEIDKGLLVLLGIENDDSKSDTDYIINKTVNLRIFEDIEGKMNRSVKDVDGEILLVSQFTLSGDTKKGNRSSFTGAMPPNMAKDFFDDVIKSFKEVFPKIQTGEFGASMEVSLINDGPVTILVDSNKTF